MNHVGQARPMLVKPSIRYTILWGKWTSTSVHEIDCAIGPSSSKRHSHLRIQYQKHKILDACTGDLQLRFAESTHLKHSKQTLNTQERSIPLKII